MSSESDHSCRICRGEATASQPLLHPCKCRGSIKYIHEECLFEWLKHSNKSTEKCDICNTPYKFKTIYDPAMPLRIPILLVWSKFIQIISSTVVKTLSITLYIICILFQVPLYWKFTGRIYTWAIDGTLPVSNPTFPDALLYGEFDIAAYLLQFKDQTPLQLTLLKIRLFVDCTFFSGVRYIIIAVIIHIALFVEHEWVVRDEGYTKLLLRKVGNEPRTKLADMLEIALQRIRNSENGGNGGPGLALDPNDNPDLNNLEVIARAMDDLQDESINHNNHQRHDLLQRAMEGGDFDDILENHVNNVNPEVNDEVESDNERRTIFVRPGMDGNAGAELGGSGNESNGRPSLIQNDHGNTDSEDEEIDTHINFSDSHEQLREEDRIQPRQEDRIQARYENLRQPNQENPLQPHRENLLQPRPTGRPDHNQARAQALAAHNRAVAQARLALHQAQAPIPPAPIEDLQESTTNEHNTDSEDDVEDDPNDTHLNLNPNASQVAEAPQEPQVIGVQEPQVIGVQEPQIIDAQIPHHPPQQPLPVQQPNPVPVAPQAAVENLFDDQEDEANAVAEANVGNGGFGEFLELFGVTLNIKTPVILMFMCDFVISAFLFIVYLIPHMLGNIFVSLTGGAFKLINNIVVQRVLPYMVQIPYILQLSYPEIETGSEFLDYLLKTLNQYIIEPFSQTFYKLFIETKLQYSLTERIILLTIGYSIIGYFIHKFMKSLISGEKPIMGTSRKIYKVLFEISSTAKVFLIFAIEIFFFPVYCGWLLDFCAAPLFLHRFTRKTDSGLTTFILLLTSYYEVLQIPYLRVFLYWGLGTLYMLFFALFVGMVRGNILRPGVLFFIRSPDDPNARLIHDALVKPFTLQLFRIYLSAKVYTGFILVGIGSVTWGLRALVSPPADVDYNVLLPIQIPTFKSLTLVSFALKSLLNTNLITKYSQMYWTRAFELSAHKLRLSHIILGKPISQERGFIVYRSFIQQILATAQPDYSKPVTYREALAIFKEDPKVLACFVPDGNYVRAPSNDTVSRKFVKKLFVAVTKDDKLLSANENANQRSGYETPTSDEDDEMNTDNAYSIVYRPPNFRLRCLGLIALLWVFAVILILTIAIFSIVLGRPIVRAVLILADLIFVQNFISLDWRLADLTSILCGLQVQMFALSYFDKTWKSGNGSNEVENNGVDVAQPQGDVPQDEPQPQAQAQARPQVPQQAPRIGHFLWSSLILGLAIGFVFFFWLMWVVSVHMLCVEVPMRFFMGEIALIEEYNGKLDSFEVNKLSLVLHFVTSFWTILVTIRAFVALHFSLHRDRTDLSFLRTSMRKVSVYLMSVHIPAGFVVLFSMFYPPTRYFALEIYIWPICFVGFALANGSHYAARLYEKINDQVKNEKFVRGRAVENIDE